MNVIPEKALAYVVYNMLDIFPNPNVLSLNIRHQYKRSLDLFLHPLLG